MSRSTSSALLDFANLSFSNLPGDANPFTAGYVRLVQDGADTLVQYDRDGSGTSYGWGVDAATARRPGHHDHARQSGPVTIHRTKELVLQRGEPWFSVRFGTHDPARPVRRFETERTPALDEHLKGLSAVANDVDRTHSLFKVASARRPDTLLQRRRSGRTADAAE